MINKINIAIDGPAASGKTSLAKKIAEHYKYLYIDTGLMYRAFTFFCLTNLNTNNINNDLSIKKISQLLNKFNIEIINNDIYINKINIEIKKLFSISISSNINFLTSKEAVRNKMVNIQKKIAKTNNCVMVGRDIGTVVLPHANFKIYLTASLEVRANRRYKQLKSKKDSQLSLLNVQNSLKKRDYSDTNRKISPLKPARDAIILDNTFLTFAETLKEAILIINTRIK